MLDDKDMFLDREIYAMVNAKSFSGRIAPKALSTIFLVFGLLGARGVYDHLLKGDAWGVILAGLVWALAFVVLIIHNGIHKQVDKARKELSLPYHT